MYKISNGNIVQRCFIPHRPRALPTKYSLAPPEEPEEPVVYALDEADDLPEKMDNPSITFLQTLYSPEDKIQIVVGKKNSDGNELPVGPAPILPRDHWIEKIKKKGGDASALFPAVDQEGVINQGLYVAINPIREAKDGRKKRNIARYQYALIEFDTISLKQQWQLLKKSRSLAPPYHFRATSLYTLWFVLMPEHLRSMTLGSLSS